MLVIRKDQINTLGKNALRTEIAFAAADIRRRLPGCCRHLSDEELRVFCQEGVRKAGAYGITEWEDVVSFLDIVVAHDLEFLQLDSFGWAEPLMTDASIGGSVKMGILLDRMPDHLRPEAVSEAAIKGGDRQ